MEVPGIGGLLESSTGSVSYGNQAVGDLNGGNFCRVGSVDRRISYESWEESALIFAWVSEGSVLIVALRVPDSAVSSGFVNTSKFSLRVEYVGLSPLLSLALFTSSHFIV